MIALDEHAEGILRDRVIKLRIPAWRIAKAAGISPPSLRWLLQGGGVNLRTAVKLAAYLDKIEQEES